jgi:hypothetical protein
MAGCCTAQHSSAQRPLLTADALETAIAGPPFDTATLLLLAEVGPAPAAAASDLASAGPPPWFTADACDWAAAGPLPLNARAISCALATPKGPVCRALEEDLAAAGPDWVNALAEPWA